MRAYYVVAFVLGFMLLLGITFGQISKSTYISQEDIETFKKFDTYPECNIGGWTAVIDAVICGFNWFKYTVFDVGVGLLSIPYLAPLGAILYVLLFWAVFSLVKPGGGV